MFDLSSWPPPSLQPTKVAPVEVEEDGRVGPKFHELSTSAESSFGNDDLSKWTLIDPQDDEVPVSSSVAQPGLNSAQATTSAVARAATTVCDHNSPTVEMFPTDLRYSPSPSCSPQTNRDTNLTSREKNVPNGDLEPIEHSSSSHSHRAEQLSTEVVAVQSPVTIPQSPPVATVPRIHAGMSAAEVAEWFRASNFENLVEKFQTFTGIFSALSYFSLSAYLFYPSHFRLDDARFTCCC